MTDQIKRDLKPPRGWVKRVGILLAGCGIVAYLPAIAQAISSS